MDATAFSVRIRVPHRYDSHDAIIADILDCHGVVIAETEPDGDDEEAEFFVTIDFATEDDANDYLEYHDQLDHPDGLDHWVV